MTHFWKIFIIINNIRRGVSKIVLCWIFLFLGWVHKLFFYECQQYWIRTQDVMRPHQSLWFWERSKPHIPCAGWIPEIPLECPFDISTKVFTAIHKSTLDLRNFCLVLCLLPCNSCTFSTALDAKSIFFTIKRRSSSTYPRSTGTIKLCPGIMDLS